MFNFKSLSLETRRTYRAVLSEPKLMLPNVPEENQVPSLIPPPTEEDSNQDIRTSTTLLQNEEQSQVPRIHTETASLAISSVTTDDLPQHVGKRARELDEPEIQQDGQPPFNEVQSTPDTTNVDESGTGSRNKKKKKQKLSRTS